MLGTEMRTGASSHSVCLLVLLILAAPCQGLDFTLSRNSNDLLGSKSSCGVLVCKQSSLSHRNGDLRTITNMAVFQTTAARPDSDNRQEHLRRLGSVSPSEPNLHQVSDGMRLHGVLKDGQATLSVELVKQKDCLADYVCELRQVDAGGNETVTSSRLVQQPDQSVYSAQESVLISSMLMRLTSMVEQMDVKLAIMEDRSADLKNDLNDKINNLENSLQGAQDKLCQLDSKLSANGVNDIQEKVLDNIKTQVDNHFEDVLTASDRTEGMLNKTATLLKTLTSNNKNFQDIMMENYQSLFNNVASGVDDMFTRNRNLSDTVEDTFISLKDDLNMGWQRLESSTKKNVFNTLAVLQNMASEFNSTLVSGVESIRTLIDIFIPSSCKKNTPVLLHPASLPYPVLYRNEFPGVDTPLLCDSLSDGGGWIVIQRRSTGKVDFYRDWASYRDGFGTLDNDFWLGNEKIHAITSTGKYELRVELEYQGQSKYAVYGRFSLASESDKYAITVGSYSGTAGDSLSYHNGRPFSTYDRDNDGNSKDCAKEFTGAWWYDTVCHTAHLNGKWGASGWRGLSWNTLTDSNSVTFSEMKIRQIDQ